MGDLEIHLLGRFRVLVDGVPVEEQRWTRKKSKVLVKLLALAPRHTLHREQVIDSLWPDADAELALNNLHKVIHAARRTLEPTLAQGTASRFLASQESQVALTGSLTIDVDAFENLAASALKSGDTQALKDALALYHGDLLEEDLYEDWASVRREQVRLRYQRLLERLAANYEAARDEQAVEILNRLLVVNRANEDAHRRLMRFYAGLGQRHLALDQYRVCCEALKQELDALPEAATTRLYESLVAGSSAPEVNAAPEAAARAVVAETQPAAIEEAARPARLPVWAAAIVGMIAMACGLLYLYTHGEGAHFAAPSLAILPLHPGNDSEQLDPVADGITEALINSTSRLPGIRVMARATVFAYKDRHDAREVGRELKVTTVLNGRVSQDNGGATVGLEMIDVVDGARLWARQYSAPAAGLASIQPLLSNELAAAVQTRLTARHPTPARRAASIDPEAYRLYLSGRFYWNKRTRSGLRKSVDFYQQAISRDPGYALAYAGLADSFGLLGWQDGLPRDYFPRARAAAARALELDESLAEAQTSLAMVSALYDWNWPAAEAQFRRAIEMNAGYATAHHWYGVHLGAMGRFDEATRELGTALELDPLSPIVNLNFGYPVYYRRRYREAMAIFQKALDIDSAFAPAHDNRISGFELQGNLPGAAKETAEFLRASDQADLAAAFEQTFRRAGYPAAVRLWLAGVERRADAEYVSPMLPAVLAIRMGDRDRAFRWLDRAFEERCAPLVYLAVDPKYDPLRADSRFQSLLRRIGLTVQVSP